ncbi:hypothetical protein M8C21_032121, partial [Ambrosia artemisiifolia]
MPGVKIVSSLKRHANEQPMLNFLQQMTKSPLFLLTGLPSYEHKRNFAKYIQKEDKDKPKTKTIKETSFELESLNDEVTEEEYTKLYHSLGKGVLFLPPKAPTDLYESDYNTNKSNLKL